MKFFDRLFGHQASEIVQMQAEAAVGNEFKTWVQSDIGRYIIGRAEQHEIAVLREIASIPPHKADEIARLQAEAKAPALLIQFIEEAMFQGEQAKFQLAELEDEL